MSDDLSRLEDWASTLLSRLSPARRRRALLTLARALRKSQAERIGRQEQPDGSAFTPRRPRGDRPPLRTKSGRIARQAKDGPMFKRIALARNMAAGSTSDEASVAFVGPGTNRIAKVHQLGLRDRVGKDPRSPEVTYPRRILLGFSDADEALVTNILTDLLAGP